MIKGKFPKQLIKERLRKIEEVAPIDKPFIIFIEQGQNKKEWIVTEQYETLNKKTKSRKYAISDLEQYIKNNSDISILVDYKIDDNNTYIIWHILLQLADEEEQDILVNYIVKYMDSNEKKDINFTRYLMELTKKYKEQFINVNLDRPYDKLTKEQLKKLIKSKKKVVK